jgi:hypothetical protein
LIDYYEKGVEFDVMDSASQSVGQTVHTLLPVSEGSTQTEPAAKKPKSSVPTVPQANTGYVDGIQRIAHI